MKFISKFSFSLAGFCLGIAQFVPESLPHNILLGIGAIAVGLDSILNNDNGKIKIKEKYATTYQMVKLLSVCQFVGVENINSNLKHRYQLVKGDVLKIANNQKREEKKLILDHLSKLGCYSDRDLVTVAEFIYLLNKTK